MEKFKQNPNHIPRMDDKVLFAMLTSGQADQVKDACEYLCQKYPGEAAAICGLLGLTADDAPAIHETAIDSFKNEMQYYEFVPKMQDKFYYALAIECMIRRLSDSGIASRLAAFDSDVQKMGWQKDPGWIKKLQSIHRAAEPEASALARLLNLRNIDVEAETLACTEALGVELRSKGKIFSARRHYIGYFVKRWNLLRVDEHFTEILKQLK